MSYKAKKYCFGCIFIEADTDQKKYSPGLLVCNSHNRPKLCSQKPSRFFDSRGTVAMAQVQSCDPGWRGVLANIYNPKN